MKINKTAIALFVSTFLLGFLAYYAHVAIDYYWFIPTSRGCGCGYIQEYKTPFGDTVFEGHYCTNDAEYREKVNLGKQLEERSDGTIIWEFVNGTETYVEILKYGDDHVFVKHAPNLKLVIEFEDWLKNGNH